MMEDVVNGEQSLEIPKGRLTFEFDPATGNLKWTREGSPIPHALLVNALELAKAIFIAEQLSGMQARRQGPPGLMMPDGTPFRR